jgi:hypothetical protein
VRGRQRLTNPLRASERVFVVVHAAFVYISLDNAYIAECYVCVLFRIVGVILLCLSLGVPLDDFSGQIEKL